ncbi:transposable element tcb2 transposase [Trichonephila clavipes]|uniref:Transposable element tcb2 transposase n=1 Tax=Trichonephila clavipes TaxID=2585209 RepID=A0A8X6S1T3_TRICX|nr:transposable element tcb2 transposase [Trichonephila clavipes]
MRPLVRLDTTLTGGRYQDNATLRMSRIATKWFQEYSSEFRLFRCPSKSPDMSIIEHFWNALRRAIQKRPPPLRTPTDLLTVLQDS